MLAGPVLAADWMLPDNAQDVSERISVFDSYALPIDVFASGQVPSRTLEGRVERRSWRVDGAASTTLQLLDPLRRQLQADGYRIVLDCADRACGGFDFRFGIEVIPAPDMIVDIGDYRFVSAARGDEETVTILVSRAGSSNYVQIIEVGPRHRDSVAKPAVGTQTAAQSGPSAGDTTPQPEAQIGDLVARLLADGHVVLDDLDFGTGATQLADGNPTSLSLLAAFLKENEQYRLYLVGHTDNVGSLQDNIVLSRKRAAAVKDRLVRQYAIDDGRLEAEGVGYLAPVASNLIPDGQKTNRRVEAVLLEQ
ncbi:OmpA family protein [Rhodobacteraceae bacterium M382]|nr:OmpA family protein [Rhodobacteraceae bacterium M382]